ncbi:MAG: antibiotic biosynthesis monooxygenase [Actinomycetota bacterium]|nr:antibiotic biosynthesis monooxygenase [Actinomycetota bacterium]
MSAVYEVVRSRVRSDAEAEMLELRPKMIAAVRERFPELIDARLIHMDDGSWMDVVQWSSREAAEKAAAAMPEIPEAAAMMGLIDEIVAFEHGVDREPGAG